MTIPTPDLLLCPRYHARLTLAACQARYRQAVAIRSGEAPYGSPFLAGCEGCPEGAERAGMPVAVLPPRRRKERTMAPATAPTPATPDRPAWMQGLRPVDGLDPDPGFKLANEIGLGAKHVEGATVYYRLAHGWAVAYGPGLPAGGQFYRTDDHCEPAWPTRRPAAPEAPKEDTTMAKVCKFDGCLKEAAGERGFCDGHSTPEQRNAARLRAAGGEAAAAPSPAGVPGVTCRFPGCANPPRPRPNPRSKHPIYCADHIDFNARERAAVRLRREAMQAEETTAAGQQAPAPPTPPPPPGSLPEVPQGALAGVTRDALVGTPEAEDLRRRLGEMTRRLGEAEKRALEAEAKTDGRVTALAASISAALTEAGIPEIEGDYVLGFTEQIRRLARRAQDAEERERGACAKLDSLAGDVQRLTRERDEAVAEQDRQADVLAESISAILVEAGVPEDDGPYFVGLPARVRRLARRAQEAESQCAATVRALVQAGILALDGEGRTMTAAAMVARLVAQRDALVRVVSGVRAAINAQDDEDTVHAVAHVVEEHRALLGDLGLILGIANLEASGAVNKVRGLVSVLDPALEEVARLNEALDDAMNCPVKNLPAPGQLPGEYLMRVVRFVESRGVQS